MKLSQNLLCCASVFVAVSATAIIDPSLKQRFLLPGNVGGGDTQNIMISFTQGIQAVINQINRLTFPSLAEKRTALTNAQKIFSDASQGQLQNFLNSMGVNYESFWINNKMIIPNVNSGLVSAISNIPGVAKIEKEPIASIELPFADEEQLLKDSGNMTRFARQSSSLAWGIEKIRADKVWRAYKGKGIVVAGIDTGVRYTHESLRGRWRTSHGWYDPYDKTSKPNDDDGHGTHTMGTIAGTNGVGVAPKATWIACKGCDTVTCRGSALYKCGQWVQCPTDPDGKSNRDCSKAPNVVSNSWGGSGGRDFYDDIITSWQAAGIVPVFSIGNKGPDCNTAGSPGDRPNVIGVGSTDSNDRISKFSSRGQSKDGKVKPDISAPGGNIRSAWHTGDTDYNSISGTSMAAPHVSGVVALMKQKKPNASFQQIFDAITKTAVTSTLDKSGAKSCDGRSRNSYPNNNFGYGRIDAVNSVNAL